MKVVWLWIGATLLIGCTSPAAGGDRPTKSGTGGSSSTPDGGPLAGTTCAGATCDTNATCSGKGDAAKCTCVAGYQGNGKTCTDIDECKTAATNDCSPNADCTNLPGTHLCKCKDGFTGDGKTCDNVDECTAKTATCDPNATCTDATPGFTCKCKSGFTGNGQGCADVNECQTPGAFKCAANAHCENTFGGYGCSCDPGFTGDGSTTCQGLCEVALTNASVCDPHGVCRIDGVAAVCDACAAGFTGTGKSCTAATSCAAECDGLGTDDDPHAVCGAILGADAGSAKSCSCAPGYSGQVGSCRDVDECATGNGGCATAEVCTNFPGGHACTCKDGFARDSTGKCTTVDACAAVPGPCPPDANCTSKTPDANGIGYTCTCKPGFTGDGTSCTDINECATNNGGCDASSTCQNNRGSFACTCPAPLIGDGGKCHCDLSGLWAMRQDLDLCWKGRAIIQGGVDVISPGNMEATVWELHELTYDGTSLAVRRKGCGSDNSPELVSPKGAFGEYYSSYTPLSVFDAIGLQGNDKYSQKSLLPGSSFTTTSTPAVVGIDLGSDPLHAAWPASFDVVGASQWTDPDNDGEPGLTFWPHVPSELTSSKSAHYSYLPVRPKVIGSLLLIDQRAGCVSVAARVITHLEGIVESCTRITGKVVNEKAEGRVHSCTLVPPESCTPNTNTCTGWQKDITCTQADWAAATRCADTDVARLDDDQNQTQDSEATFELVKIGAIGDSLNCSDVRTQLPSIPHTTPTISCTTPL